MVTCFALLLLLAAPFWEAKAPAQWTDAELAELLGSSPWVKTLAPKIATGDIPALHVHLATARPLRDAEQEFQRRLRLRAEIDAPDDQEYEEFLRDNQGRYIVLAVQLSSPGALADPKEVSRMEEESFLRVDRKKIKMTGHFPPTASDPYLRLVFPRAIEPGTKSVVFDLYLPSVPSPYRQVEFWLRDLLWKGKPEL
jgi:hypothetical protein